MFNPDSFRAARWVRTLNLILQAVLFLTFFGGLNYLAVNHSWRFDLTQHRSHSLSPETLSYLRNLQRPVHVAVTFTEEAEDPAVAQAYRDISGLLREYTYATEGTEGGRISVEYLDIYQRRREADLLGVDQPNSIVLLCGDRRRVVTLGELYKVENREKQAFRGEQALTAAILDVSSPGRKKIYFLAGHGELRPDDVDPVRGLSALRDELLQRNLDVDTLDLAYTRAVPEDAALLVVTNPQGPLQSFEQELLRQYLTVSAGRLILLVAPAQPHGLEDLLYDWGILVDDNLVCDTGAENMTEEGDLILRAFQSHPITQTLINYQIALRIGPSRSVRPDPGRSAGASLTVTTLAATSTSAWGETSYRLRRIPEYNRGVDLKGLPQMDPANRLGVIVASERVQAREDLPFSVRGGRLVVFGTGDVVANNRIANAGNQNIFLGAVNWALDRDTQLNIPARPIQRFQLSLSHAELVRLRYSLLLALPGAAALLGLFVYWSRRN